MSVSPISPIISNNRNCANIQFEGKNKKNTQEHSASTMPLKAIPLVALLAMSPINESYSQSLVNNANTTVSVYNHNDGTSTKIFTYKEKDPNVLQAKDSLILVFTSTDGDDKPETARYITNKTDYTSIKDEAGNRVRIIEKEKENVKCKALEKREFKSTDKNGNEEISYGYYLHGSSMILVSQYSRENPQVRIGKGKVYKNPDCVIPISEYLYNIIADTIGDKIEYINK